MLSDTAYNVKSLTGGTCFDFQERSPGDSSAHGGEPAAPFTWMENDPLPLVHEQALMNQFL